jgi:hypothetical protein
MLRSATQSFRDLAQAKCVVPTVRTVREPMHKVVIAKGRNVTRIALMKIIVSFHRRRYFMELELIDLLV